MIDPTTTTTRKLSFYGGPGSLEDLFLAGFRKDVSNYAVSAANFAAAANTFTKAETEAAIQEAVNAAIEYLTASVVMFRAGDPLFPSPEFPADGETLYTNSEFAGKSLIISSSLVGSDLIYGRDYFRKNGIGGVEDPLGDTVSLINGYDFSGGSTWAFYKGLALENSEEVLNAAKSYALMLFNTVAGGVGVATPTSMPQTGVSIYRAYIDGTYANFLAALATPIEVEESDLVNGYVELVKNPDTGFYEKKVPVVPPASIQVEHVSGKTVTNSLLVGRKVTVVFISNQAPKQTGFEKPLGDDTLTFTDSTNLTDKIVTLLLQ